MRTRPVVGLLLAVLIVSPVLADSGSQPSEPLVFVPVQALRASVAVRRSDGPEQRRNVGQRGVSAVRNRLAVRLPANPPRAVMVAPERVGQPRAVRLSGTASWYCGHGSACTSGYPGGLYAAAGPALRVGQWRERRVRVILGGQSVVVELIDWCACPNGRLLDLYSTAFDRLAPLSRGVLTVTVEWN